MFFDIEREFVFVVEKEFFFFVFEFYYYYINVYCDCEYFLNVFWYKIILNDKVFVDSELFIDCKFLIFVYGYGLENLIILVIYYFNVEINLKVFWGD